MLNNIFYSLNCFGVPHYQIKIYLGTQGIIEQYNLSDSKVLHYFITLECTKNRIQNHYWIYLEDLLSK